MYFGFILLFSHTPSFRVNVYVRVTTRIVLHLSDIVVPMFVSVSIHKTSPALQPWKPVFFLLVCNKMLQLYSKKARYMTDLYSHSLGNKLCIVRIICCLKFMTNKIFDIPVETNFWTKMSTLIDVELVSIVFGFHINSLIGRHMNTGLLAKY